jgi:hypothetical protein
MDVAATVNEPAVLLCHAFFVYTIQVRFEERVENLNLRGRITFTRDGEGLRVLSTNSVRQAVHGDRRAGPGVD